jgi:hypothetical protein
MLVWPNCRNCARLEGGLKGYACSAGPRFCSHQLREHVLALEITTQAYTRAEDGKSAPVRLTITPTKRSLAHKDKATGTVIRVAPATA